MNPNEIFDARLSNIEAKLSELIQAKSTKITVSTEESRYGNFAWYVTETGEAQSTARQRIARGEVPGVTKLGKRLLIEKNVVRQWIKENQRQTSTDLATLAEATFTQRHARTKKGGKAA